MSDTPTTLPLEHRVILITGASRGIGRAVALAAAKQGAELIITGRTMGALEELDDEISAVGANATIVELGPSAPVTARGVFSGIRSCLE
ncbi:MAG: SDR family NAD(P)-dependent oxidoreductase, partial [Candidatus Puniceispirillaceae bacterium]